MVARRSRVTALSKRKRRQSIKRRQVKFRKKTIEVRRAVSERGREHPMARAGIRQPQTAQNLLMESTAIRRFKYYIEEKRLRIWFVSKGVYDYFNVPESVVLDFANAQSKGRYFHNNIYGEWEGKPNQHPGVMRLNSAYDFKRIR